MSTDSLTPPAHFLPWTSGTRARGDWGRGKQQSCTCISCPSVPPSPSSHHVYAATPRMTRPAFLSSSHLGPGWGKLRGGGRRGSREDVTVQGPQAPSLRPAHVMGSQAIRKHKARPGPEAATRQAQGSEHVLGAAMCPRHGQCPRKLAPSTVTQSPSFAHRSGRHQGPPERPAGTGPGTGSTCWTHSTRLNELQEATVWDGGETLPFKGIVAAALCRPPPCPASSLLSRATRTPRGSQHLAKTHTGSKAWARPLCGVRWALPGRPHPSYHAPCGAAVLPCSFPPQQGDSGAPSPL